MTSTGIESATLRTLTRRSDQLSYVAVVRSLLRSLDFCAFADAYKCCGIHQEQHIHTD